MELEDVAEPLLERFHGPGAVAGDCWKSNGSFGDLGPYGPGDERSLGPFCNHAPAARYAAIYKRRTHDWKKHDELIALIDGLQAAKRAGPAPLRAFLEQTFDVRAVLSHIAMINWAGAWDDNVHNHFLYRRPDGKWQLMAWDFDQLFGGGAGIDGNAAQSANHSFYVSEEGDPNNRLGWNQIKDAFIRTYRSELGARFVELSKTILAPEAVIKLADEGLAAFSLPDWTSTPGRQSCNVTARVDTIRRWARDRHVALQARFPM